MKPLKLTIEGINSFVEPRTVDFEQLSQNGIFCICGPTGSGKTTILDCIILALYAPPSHHRGTLKEYINTKCDKGKITLEFTADGKRYEVYRELRRNSSSAAKLINSDTNEVIADRADSVTDEIKKMLKLDKEDFTKVVVLEQGRFAEFMRLTKTERFKTVSKLFGLERFERLKGTIADAKNKYDRLIAEKDAALATYDGITEEAHASRMREIKQLESEIAAKRKEREECEKSLKGAELLMQAYEKRKAAAETIEALNKELQVVADERKAHEALRLRLEDDAKKLRGIKEKSDGAHAMLSRIEECARDIEEIKRLELRRQELREKYNSMKSAADGFKAQTESLNVEKEKNLSEAASIMRDVEALGYTVKSCTEAGFAEAKASARADSQRLAGAAEKLNAAKQKVEACEKIAEELYRRQNELKSEIARVENVLNADKAKYEKAKAESAAAAVRSSLIDGDACPVCGGVYHGGKCSDNLADDALLGELKKATEQNESALKNFNEELKKCEVEYSRNGEALKAAKQSVSESEALRGGKTSEAAAKVEKLAERGESAMKNSAAADKTIADLSAKLAATEAELKSCTDEGKSVKSDIDKRNNNISERLGGKSITAAETEAKATIAEFEKAQREFEEASEALQKSEAELSAREAAAKAKKEHEQKTLDETPEEKFDAPKFEAATKTAAALAEEITAIDRRIGGAKSEAEEIKRRLSEKKNLAREKRELMKIRDDIGILNKCVERDNKLLAYVAEEYLQSFTGSASETLSFLTGGKYTLWYDDGDFYVEDFFADNVRRKVKTLSGGETFLASVSIAMAISQEIAAQNYEFFFLDEGFGTLHEGAMETITDALFKLSKSTTVGIVTHRGELAERIPSRLNVIPATEDAGSDISFT